jgi:SanA protein
MAPLSKSAKWRKGVGAILLLVCALGAGSDAWIWWTGRREIVPLSGLCEPGIILVPGASVLRNGRLSPILRQRVESALELARAWPSARLVLSGTAIVGGYDEPLAMRNFLVEHGVDSGRLVLDREGRNTRASMKNLGAPAKGLVIVSQHWHLPRAIWLAQQEGWTAQGLVAGEGTPDGGENIVREHFVRMVNFWWRWIV